MKRLFAVLLFLPPVAWAQNIPSQDSSQETPPKPAGAPHVCPEREFATDPRWKNLLDILATVILSYRITTTGDVADVRVIESSGLREFDKAVANCVASWRYFPATRGGKPVEVQWKTHVVWKNKGERPMPDLAERQRDCVRAHPVSAAQLEGIDGTTQLSFGVSEGVVLSAAVTRSSGSDELDRAAAECVKSWRFMALIPGTTRPSFMRWATIDWKQALKPVN